MKAREFRVFFTAAPSMVMRPNGGVQPEMTVATGALYALGAVAEEAGFPCSIQDPADYWRTCRTEEQLAEAVRGHEVVCLSANSMTWAIAKVLISRIARLDPRPLIVVGGLHATYCDEHVMRTTEADVIVRGEGEHTLVELLRAMAEGRPLEDVAGLTFRHDGQISRTSDRPPLTADDLSRTPLPLWDRLPRGVYGFIPVEMSRGCQFSCVFCSIYHRRLWRSPAPQTVAERIRHAARHLDRVHYQTLMFTDDCFTTDARRVRSVCQTLEQMGSDVAIGIEARAANMLNRSILRSLERVKIDFIQLGVECGYPEGLRKVRKGVTVEQVIASAHALHAVGIHREAKYSYIVGFPWESEREMKRTIAFAMSLGSLYGNHVQVAWLLLLPGSNIYRQFRKEGRVTETDFDVLPWENQDSFFRMHPTVDRVTTGRIEEYAGMLEQDFPWVTVIGSVFRPWTHYAHYPFDRVVPTSRRGKGCDGEKPSICPKGFWNQLPPVLRRLAEGD